MARIGVVLGAGGIVGHAFHAGVLAALAEVTGWEPREAEVVVGTSAGSVVGALLRAGMGAGGLVRQTLALCCADPARLPPDIVAAHVAMARERRAMPWAQAAFLEAARSIMVVLARRRHLHALIAGIEAPTRIVQGSEDRLVPLAGSRATAALRRDWTLAVFEGVGHVPQLEAPERFVETVVGWLEGQGREAVGGLTQRPPAPG